MLHCVGVNSPRSRAANGSPLPSARQVSVTLTQDIDSPSENYTMLLMQWGQFLDHDLTHTPISRGEMGSGISCCRNGREIESSLRHPDCYQIEIPRNDHMYAPFSERCMEFVRSLPAPRPECNFGPREQVNKRKTLAWFMVLGFKPSSCAFFGHLFSIS